MQARDRQEERLAAWVEARGKVFRDEEARERYRLRAGRLAEAVRLRRPDRVPVPEPAGLLYVRYGGLTVEEAMKDYERGAAAWKRFSLDLDFDAYAPAFLLSGRYLEILGFRNLRWPGHGISVDTGYQYVEAEYMRPEEYPELIADPTDFWLRKYYPRILGALEPWAELPPLTEPLPLSLFGAFGREDLAASLAAVAEAGREGRRLSEVLARVTRELEEQGMPAYFGGFTLAPFDIIADYLRGTRGVMLDIYKRPEELLRAVEALVPVALRWARAALREGASPLVLIPLHKGADGWLSVEQFRTFYWPTLRRVVLGLIEEGLVPMVAAEGRYTSRLEIIRDLPRAATVWMFEATDMTLVKEALGGVACVAGNVPISLLSLGTPAEVKDYCRRLLAAVAKDGGFILDPASAIDTARVENLQAMIEAAREFEA